MTRSIRNKSKPRSEGRYAGFLIGEGRRKGGILLGGTAAASERSTAVESGRDVSSVLGNHPDAAVVYSLLCDAQSR